MLHFDDDLHYKSVKNAGVDDDPGIFMLMIIKTRALEHDAAVLVEVIKERTETDCDVVEDNIVLQS